MQEPFQLGSQDNMSDKIQAVDLPYHITFPRYAEGVGVSVGLALFSVGFSLILIAWGSLLYLSVDKVTFTTSWLVFAGLGWLVFTLRCGLAFRTWWKHYRSLGIRRLTISDNGLRFRDGFTEDVIIHWNEVLECRETENTMILRFSARRPLILDKDLLLKHRCFKRVRQQIRSKGFRIHRIDETENSGTI